MQRPSILIPLFAIFCVVATTAEYGNDGDNSANPVAAPTTTPTPVGPQPRENMAEHEELTADLMEAKKGFEQKYLDCDEGLKKLVTDIESGIVEHEHEKVKEWLKELKAYKVNEDVKDPCAAKEEKVTPKPETGSKNPKAKAAETKDGEKNGAVGNCNNLSWSIMLLPLLTLVGGGGR